MKIYYTSPRDYWDSEIEFTKAPDVWKSEAIGLWLSAINNVVTIINHQWSSAVEQLQPIAESAA